MILFLHNLFLPKIFTERKMFLEVVGNYAFTLNIYFGKDGLNFIHKWILKVLDLTIIGHESTWIFDK